MFGLVIAILAAAASPVGIYEASQMEMAAGLELRADGRFEFGLEYGAISEEGKGRWVSAGANILLTADPMPKAPAYVLVSDEPLPKSNFSITVVEPDSPYFERIDVGIEIDGGPGKLVQIGKSDVVGLPPGKKAKIIPMIPVYGEPGASFELNLDRGHALRLRFEANQLGMARFDQTPLAVEGDDLLLERYGATIRFKRVKP